VSETESHRVETLILSHVTGGKPPVAVVIPRDRWLALRHELMPSLINVGVVVLPSMQSAEESREHFLFNGIPIVSGETEHVEMSAQNVIFQYETDPTEGETK